MKAIARHVRVSPKKANLVAGLVRNKNAQEALHILKFTPKKSAKLIYKVVRSAVANAENNFKQNKDELIIKEIVVTKGITMKRNMPVSRGRTHPILKPTSHITVKVGLPETTKKENTKDDTKNIKTAEKTGKLSSSPKNN